MTSITDSILKRVMSAAAAAGAIGACAAVAVVAAAFALYAVGKALVGAPIAAAIIALIFALIAGVAAVVSYGGAKGGRKPKKLVEPPPSTSMIDQAVVIAKERPFIAAGVAVVAGFLALRNPLIVSTLMATLMQPRRSPPPR